ncbi:glycosyltransferase [Aggregatimonas sangjinii]|uniref:Glycosyltransferase n=1 Tax=Aggregatimonas sangjinii TaxID=2583587 RepID=A0A5B7SME4_9FLAO|nr:glycosyltransferase [Aggregatimonas sangjinii]QCW99656.1 glycosyltransferase [Aggregatimonas sangjinii]
MNTQRKKVIFILPTLLAGGAERVVSFIAQNINAEKFEVCLLIVGFESDSAYAVNGVRKIFLEQKRVLYAIPKLIKVLKKERPDLAFSSIAHMNVAMGLASLFLPKIKFIGRQASVGKITASVENDTQGWFGRNLTNYGLRKLDTIVCQSEDMLNDLLENHRLDKAKTVIIHNPITQFPENCKKIGSPGKTKTFITVGRLTEIKGYLRILDALGKLTFDFRYIIIGDGPQKDIIMNKIKTLDLVEKVEYISFTNEVHKYLLNADFFLQGSYAEGFPNAVLESCSVGTTVIAFACPGGTREIITHGENGYLAKDEKEFLKYLDAAVQFDPIKVRESVYKKFNQNKIISEYEELFMKLTTGT